MRPAANIGDRVLLTGPGMIGWGTIAHINKGLDLGIDSDNNTYLIRWYGKARPFELELSRGAFEVVGVVERLAELDKG